MVSKDKLLGWLFVGRLGCGGQAECLSETSGTGALDKLLVTFDNSVKFIIFTIGW